MLEIIINSPNNLPKELPDKITDIIACDNTRCITSDENYVPKIFNLVDREHGIYRCEYCNHRVKLR